MVTHSLLACYLGLKKGLAPSQTSLSLLSEAHTGARAPCPLQITRKDSQRPLGQPAWLSAPSAVQHLQAVGQAAEGKGPLLLARKGLTLVLGLIGRTATAPSGTMLGMEVGLRTRPLNPKVMGSL